MTFKLSVWTLIPAILILTLFYLGLGSYGHWNYGVNDFINGNIIVSFGVGLFYTGDFFYKKVIFKNGKYK